MLPIPSALQEQFEEYLRNKPIRYIFHDPIFFPCRTSNHTTSVVSCITCRITFSRLDLHLCVKRDCSRYIPELTRLAGQTPKIEEA